MIWTLFGSLAFGDDTGQGLIGNPTQYAGLSRLLTEAADQGHTYPTILFAVFQGLFCVITGALISGAIADRAKFTSWLIYVGAWTVLVYAPVAHWVFDISHDVNVGGWLANRIGVIDFAGGTAVEICSGASGLALAVVLGQRVGFGKDPMRPHNLTCVMLGAGLLWFGWFGFTAGSALAAGHTAGIVFAPTLLAGATGVAGWLIVERLRDGVLTSFGAASGLVGGWSRSRPRAARSRPSEPWSWARSPVRSVAGRSA